MGLNRETGKSRYGHAAVTGSNAKYAIGEIREGWSSDELKSEELLIQQSPLKPASDREWN